MDNLAFLISCEEYVRDDFKSLSGIKEDVPKMKAALIEHGGILEKNCYCLCQSEDAKGGPTEPEIWKLFEMPNSSIEYGAIYIYYSGHGFQNRDNELCITTRDSRLDPYPMMYIKIEEIVSFLKTTYECKHIIFILDMCQTYRIDAKGLSDIEFPYGVITICSCLPDTEAYLLSHDKGSFFTSCFIEALEQANITDTIAQIVEKTRNKMISIDKHLNLGQVCYLKADYYELGNLTLKELVSDENKNSDNFFLDINKNVAQQDDLWHVPEMLYDFYGRERELQWIDNCLREYDKAIFISGDGGIGKTTLILHYARQNPQYRYCFLSYRDSLFHTIATLKMPENSSMEDAKINNSEKCSFEENIKCLEQYGKKLVIFIDNFDAENYDQTFFKLIEQKPASELETKYKNENIIKYLERAKVHLIFTTRVKIPKNKYKFYKLEPLHSLTLLKMIEERCNLLVLEKKEKEMLTQIIGAVNGLTILVELICAVLNKKADTNIIYELSEIILNEKYTEFDMDVESEYDSRNMSIFHHLHEMFKLLELSDTEQGLLRIISLLPYEGINVGLFYNLNKEKLNDTFLKNIHELDNLRLINITKKKIFMHPIISAFVKIELKPDAKNCQGFIKNLLDAYHTDATEVYIKESIEEICLTLVQAAKRIDEPLEKAELYSKAGVIARRSGWYIYSRDAQTKAISILEKIFPLDLERLATYHSNIANLYLDMADLDNALLHQEKAIQMRKEKFGENHVDTAMSYCNKALILAQKAEYKGAKKIQKKAIQILKKIQKGNELSLATAYSNMAQICYDQNNYEAAVTWERRALKIREIKLDKDSPYLATSYNNISLYLHKIGSENEAEEYARRAIDIQERVLGLNHPYLVISYNNLALVLKAKGDYDAAIEYQFKDIHIQQQGGRKHWNLATSYDNLARLMMFKGDYQEAEKNQKHAIDIREEVQGEKHPDLIWSYQNMVDILEEQNKYEEAKSYREKLSVFEKLGISDKG